MLALPVTAKHHASEQVYYPPYPSTDIDLMCLYLKMRMLRLEAIPCPLVPCYIQQHPATPPWGASTVLGDVNMYGSLLAEYSHSPTGK